MISARPLSETNNQAIRLLMHEMSEADTAQFIGQFTTGYYTEERKELFRDLTLGEMMDQIRSRKRKNT